MRYDLGLILFLSQSELIQKSSESSRDLLQTVQTKNEEIELYPFIMINLNQLPHA